MKKVLLDTNIILDFILEREPFYIEAEKILNLAFDNKIIAHLSATSTTDIYYIAKKVLGKKETLNLLKSFLTFIEISNVDKQIIMQALNSQFNDFEDAVQDSTADFNNINIIITRNIKDYKTSSTTVMVPEKFLNKYFK